MVYGGKLVCERLRDWVFFVITDIYIGEVGDEVGDVLEILFIVISRLSSVE